MLKKINAIFSILTIFLFCDHTIMFLLYKAEVISKDPGVYGAIAFGIVLLVHAILSLILVFRNKPAMKFYPKQNADTLKQRLFGYIIILLSIIHVVLYLLGVEPAGQNLVIRILLFILGLALLTLISSHMAISLEKAFITLKIGKTDGACKAIKIASEIFVIIVYLLAIVLMAMKYFMVA